MVSGKDSWQLVGLLWLCFVLAQFVLLTLFRPLLGKATVETIILLNSFALMFILLLPTVAFGSKRKWDWLEAFRLRPVSWKVIAFTVFGTLALGLSVSQVTLWLIQKLESTVIVEHGKLTNLLSATVKAKSLPLLILAVALPALPEELVFRGVVQQGFERRYSPKTAIVLTGAIFALFHLDPLQTFSVIAIAIFWGWVVWKSRSVLPSLFAHAIQNVLTVISVTLASETTMGIWEAETLNSFSPNWLAAFAGLLLWLVSVLILSRLLSTRGESDGKSETRIQPDQTGATFGGS